MSAPTVFDFPAPVPEAAAQEKERGSTVSESELSTLDYSFFSDESLNVRDEVEALSRLQVSESRDRDLLGSFQTEEDQEVDDFVATHHPTIGTKECSTTLWQSMRENQIVHHIIMIVSEILEILFFRKKRHSMPPEFL
jgi:hypothetical protein